MASSVSSRVLGGRAGRKAAARAAAYASSPKLAAAIAKAEGVHHGSGDRPAARPHKYGVSAAAERRHPSTGELFASKAELKRWLYLELLQRAGEISGLERQVQFSLTIPAHQSTTGNWVLPQYVGCYIADAVYRDESGVLVVEDVKGVQTPEYKLKKRLVKALHGIDIQEVAV